VNDSDFTPEPTIEDAKAVIERMKPVRPSCESCSVLSYDWPRFTRESGEAPPIVDADAFAEKFAKLVGEHLPAGYEQAAWMPAYIKRCERCASAHAYPWATRLEPEKVLAYMLEKHPYVFEVSELESTLSDGGTKE
jgi:hypothetical protein